MSCQESYGCFAKTFGCAKNEGVLKLMLGMISAESNKLTINCNR
jgi:hypothetical protein